jgi:hypothetical protein
LPPHITKWAPFAVGLVNIILRLKTTQPLTRRCEDKPLVVPKDRYAGAALKAS